MPNTNSSLPHVVSHEEWRKAREALLAKEKDLTHARDALAAEQRWLDGPRKEGLRTLRTLLAWLGAEAPVHEAEVMALATTVPGLSGKRVVAFLAEQHLLVPDPAKQRDTHQQVTTSGTPFTPMS